MSGVRVFMLEPTARVRRSLRRYHSCTVEKCGAIHAHKCPRLHQYHDAQTPLDELEASYEVREVGARRVRVYTDAMHRGPPRNDPRWPTACSCGYVFADADAWQVFHEAVFRRADTGALTTIREAPEGAMWNAEWLTDWPSYTGADGRSLVVKCPGGHDWHIESIASNCGLKDGRPDGKFCWQRSGEPPVVTVARGSCPNCGVGGGSIGTPNWHGYLTAGELVTG